VQIVAIVPEAVVTTPQGAEGKAAPLLVQHDAPGQLHGPLLERAPILSMSVEVKLARPATVQLQVDVSKPDGTFVAQWSDSAHVTSSIAPWTVPLSAELAELAKHGGLVFSRAALLVDGDCSDLVRVARPMVP
jgi:hypothetical protein